MPVWVRDSGVWKHTEQHVRVGGVWKSMLAVDGSGNMIAGAKVKVSGEDWLDATAASTQTAGVVTQGSDFLYRYTWTSFKHYFYTDHYARGFNSATDHDFEWSRTVAFGSMTLGADFTDSRGIDRNIAAVYNINFFPDRFVLSLDGTSIPNDDRTFYSLTTNQASVLNVFKRANATYLSNTNGGTTWYWDANNSLGPTVAFTVIMKFDPAVP